MVSFGIAPKLNRTTDHMFYFTLFFFKLLAFKQCHLKSHFYPTMNFKPYDIVYGHGHIVNGHGSFCMMNFNFL